MMFRSVIQLPRTRFGQSAGEAVADELAAMEVARPLVVTDRGLIEAGIAARVLSGLARFGEVPVFADVTENPLFSDADRGIEFYRRENCDGVVALGGGSAIDTAKFIALLATNGGRVADYVGPEPHPHRRCAPLIVVPTTAGTGSEASPDAGIHPDPNSAAVGIRSRHVVPDVAVLDPELTLTLPARLTAATGIDAISHCIEGFLSVETSPPTDAILLDALRRAVPALRTAVRDGGDLHARGEMLWAAYAGGVGIGMGLGAAHAVAIACGDQGFPHGVLSGIGLVCTLDAIAGHAPDRAAALKAALGLAADASLSAAIADLMRSLGAPATLAELGYRISTLDDLATTAHRAPFNFTARHHFSASEFAELIRTSSDHPSGAGSPKA